MPKLFYMQLVTARWRAAVAGCSANAIGCWIQLITAMWDEGQVGFLEGTVRDLASKCGLQADEFGEGLSEIQRKGVGNVTPSPVVKDDRGTLVRVECRHMMREYADRLRKDQWDRDKRTRTDEEPTKNRQLTDSETTGTRAHARFNFNSESSGSESGSEGKSAEKGFDFEALYSEYPRKDGKKKGMQRCRSQITTQAKYNALQTAIGNYRAKITAEVIELQFVKQFDTFMSCWEDYIDPPVISTRARASPSKTILPAPVTAQKSGNLNHKV